MSKNTHHYNWNLWSSKNKKLTERKRIILKEMDEQFVNMIEPAIIAAGQGQNKNFAPYFGNKNRIVIPYDTSKVSYIVYLAGICAKYIKEAIFNQVGSYMRTDIYKKDKDQYDAIITNLENQGKYNEAYIERELFGSREPSFVDLTFEISNISTIQKGVGAGGVGVVEKQINVYEPILKYNMKRPIPIGTEEYSNTNRFRIVSYKATIGEILKKNKEQELFNEWNGAKGISSVREKICQDKEIIETAANMFNSGYRELINYSLDSLKEKLNISKTPAQSEYSIVISRAPIDVLRMSDFKGMSSCHSAGREFFYCALAESRNQGAIAFLVNTKDLEKIDLQDDEIFKDYDRSVGGIIPISRVRIRRIVDETMKNDYMVVEDAIYGSRKAFFVDTVRNWAANAQKDMFVLGDTPQDIYVPEAREVSLKGGSYTDIGSHGLGSELGKIISYSIKSKFGTDVLEKYRSEIGAIQYIDHTGIEDEDELDTACSDAENAKDEWENRVSNINYVSSVSFDVECNGRGLDRIDMNIELETLVITDGEEYNEKKHRFNTTKIKELLQGNHFHVSYRTDATFTKKLEKYFNSISYFKDLVGYDVEGGVHVTDDRIDYTISFKATYPTSNEAEYFSNRFYTILKKFDHYEFFDVCLEFAEEMEWLEEQPFDIANEYSLQRFAEDLAKSRNHFRYSQKDSTEGKDDVYSLMGNPEATYPSSINAPIIGIIPFEYELREKFMELFQYGNSNFQNTFRNKFENNMYKLNSSVDEFALRGEYNSRQQQIYMGQKDKSGKEVRAETPSARLPDPDNLSIVLTAGEENTFQQARSTRQIEVKLLFDIHINAQMSSENEIMSAMNFMDIYGGEKYDEIIKLATEAFKEAWKEFGFEIPRLISKLGEPKQKKPEDFNSLEAGVKTGNLPLYTMKSVEQPEDKNEAKQNKKLIINERFKRLLRNMKK